MGDSHRGFRIVATDDNFYEHYRYSGDHRLQLAQGVRPAGIFNAVLGSAVAAQIHYQLGQKIVFSHGLEGSFLKHTADPYNVAGIMAHTATPVDRAMLNRRFTNRTCTSRPSPLSCSAPSRE
jgi:putative ABC transport system permease protein